MQIHGSRILVTRSLIECALLFAIFQWIFNLVLGCAGLPRIRLCLSLDLPCLVLTGAYLGLSSVCLSWAGFCFMCVFIDPLFYKAEPTIKGDLTSVAFPLRLPHHWWGANRTSQMQGGDTSKLKSKFPPQSMSHILKIWAEPQESLNVGTKPNWTTLVSLKSSDLSDMTSLPNRSSWYIVNTSYIKNGQALMVDILNGCIIIIVEYDDDVLSGWLLQQCTAITYFHDISCLYTTHALMVFHDDASYRNQHVHSWW